MPVEVVSERLGHASATITLTAHQHVHPGMGREAADRFATLLEGLNRGANYRAGTTRPSGALEQETPGS